MHDSSWPHTPLQYSCWSVGSSSRNLPKTSSGAAQSSPTTIILRLSVDDDDWALLCFRKLNMITRSLLFRATTMNTFFALLSTPQRACYHVFPAFLSRLGNPRRMT